MITSTTNKQIKNILLLKKKSKARREQRTFLVEGMKMVAEAPVSWIREIYVSASFAAEMNRSRQMQEWKAKLVSGGRDLLVEEVSDAVFRAISDTVTPQGILALIAMPLYSLEDVLADGDWTMSQTMHTRPHILLLEALQDPGNLGTIFRTGEGAGVTGIIMSRDTVDIYNPKTIRSTMGSIYRVPFLIAEDFGETVSRVKNRGVSLYAAHLKGQQAYDTFDYTSATGFLIGNEGNGLTRETADMADTYIRIPMDGQLESLNAAMAAGILMYETNRQRRGKNENLV